MSLYKQLWLFIILLLASVFLGCLILSSISTRNYLQEHLGQKNNDNALTMALSLSSGDQDKLSMELAVNSQFDLGHYHFIVLKNAQGETIAARYDDRDYRDAPEWLIKLFPIEIRPGVASVNHGWQQAGTLTLASHVRFAYKQLWDNAKQLFYYFILVSLTFFAIGTLAISWLKRSLGRAVEQAQAIGYRRFITIPEPRTPELRSLVHSLNNLSRHVAQTLAEESVKLETLKNKAEFDELTGLNNRGPLLRKLKQILLAEGKPVGTLLLFRFGDLFNLNQKLGRQLVDAWLVDIAKELVRICSRHDKNSMAGRLNGSDFMLVLPQTDLLSDNNSKRVASEIHQSLLNICMEHKLDKHSLTTSSTNYDNNENLSTLLSRLDSGLLQAHSASGTKCVFIEKQTPNATTKNDWSQLFEHAFANRGFQAQLLPFFSADGHGVHQHVLLRLPREDGSYVQETELIPHIFQLDLHAKMDLTKLEMAINLVGKNPQPLSISLSTASLTKPAVQQALVRKIREHDNLAHYLNIEFPEYSVVQNLATLTDITQQLLALNCKVGLSQTGQEIEHIAKLHNLGLHYVKIDAVFTHEIQHSPAHQAYIHGFCTVLHSIGMLAFADEVNHHQQWQTLKTLGVDGASGKVFASEA